MIQPEKIEKFLSDEAMVISVVEALRNSFMKPRAEKDVYYLAAKSLAIEFLEEACHDLSRYAAGQAERPQERRQIGL